MHQSVVTQAFKRSLTAPSAVANSQFKGKALLQTSNETDNQPQTHKISCTVSKLSSQVDRLTVKTKLSLNGWLKMCLEKHESLKGFVSVSVYWGKSQSQELQWHLNKAHAFMFSCWRSLSRWSMSRVSVNNSWRCFRSCSPLWVPTFTPPADTVTWCRNKLFSFFLCL